MDSSLLQQVYGNETLLAWIKFGSYLLLAFVLRRPLSRWLSLFAVRLGKKQYRDTEAFVQRIRKPVSHLLFSTLCFVAFHQLEQLPQLLLLHYPTVKGLEKGVTLSALIDHIFELSVILLAATLIARTGTFMFQEWIQKSAEEGEEGRNQLLPYMMKAFQFVVWLIAVFVILGGVFHMNVPALIASLGIGGVALALAAKETVENTLASFIILVDKPFQIGETIKIGNLEGTVERIGFRSSRIRSAAQTLIIVPNKKLVDDNLENLSERGKQRLSASFALQYGTSSTQVSLVTDRIKKMLADRGDILPPVSVFLSSFAESALQITVGYFVHHPLAVGEVNTIREEVNKAVYDIVAQEAGGFAVPAQLSISDHSA